MRLAPGSTAAAVAAAAAFALALASASVAHAPVVLSGGGRAVIDGRLAPGEWDGAARVDASFRSFDLRPVPATLHVMNDFHNLYLALAVRHTTLRWTSVGYMFDGDNDGTATPLREDAARLDYGVAKTTDNPTYTDSFLCADGRWCFDVDVAGRTDGEAVATNDGNGLSIYELSKPLASGDQYDVRAAVGQTVGFNASFAMFNESRTQLVAYGYFPDAGRVDFAAFGDIRLIVPPPPSLGSVRLSYPARPAPVAGSRFAVRVQGIELRDTQRFVAPDRVSCSASLARTRLRSMTRDGCSWSIPRTAGLKLLATTLKVGYENGDKTITKRWRVR